MNPEQGGYFEGGKELFYLKMQWELGNFIYVSIYIQVSDPRSRAQPLAWPVTVPGRGRQNTVHFVYGFIVFDLRLRNLNCF